MWIPYDISGTLTPASDPAAIRRAREDGSPRPFVVGFMLRNPVTQSWELDVAAEPAGTRLDEDGAELILHGNDSGKLAEVLFTLTAGSPDAALARAHALLTRRLLRYGLESGRGMAIAGWRIADARHGARWRCTPFRPSALTLDHAGTGPVPDDLAPLAELFQRARAAAEPASRLIAAFGVLYAAAAGHPAISTATRDGFRVTAAMLAHAGAGDVAASLAGAELTALIAVLRPHHDLLIGANGVMIPRCDDLGLRQELARLANLADLAAHRLLLAELRRRQAPGDAPAADRSPPVAGVPDVAGAPGPHPLAGSGADPGIARGPARGIRPC